MKFDMSERHVSTKYDNFFKPNKMFYFNYDVIC